jgi:hypothetical protein
MEDETDLSTLEAARILKLNAALIDQVGNEVQQIIQSVAHLF